MTDKIDWSKAPDGATHWCPDRHCWLQVIERKVFFWSSDPAEWVLSNQHITSFNASKAINNYRPTPVEIPEPKRLTQAVFDGLPSEYRWAAVDADAKACAYTDDPERDEEIGIFGYFSYANRAGADYIAIGKGYDATDWQNSKIERQDVPSVGCTGIPVDVPTADIDWSTAPEGATHYNTYSHQWFAVYDDGTVMGFDRGMWHKLTRGTVFDLESAAETIKRPESITDVARSIEAARVDERKHGHYFKDVSSIAQIDVYAVLRLFEVADPCLQHIVKKALCAGKRGAKDFAKDVQEIADTAQRLVELERGK